MANVIGQTSELVRGGQKLKLHGEECQCKIPKFSYVEGATRVWMDRSVVGRKKMEVDVCSLQNSIKSFGMKVHIFHVGEVYCHISFAGKSRVTIDIERAES